METVLSFPGLEDVQLIYTPSEPPGVNGKRDVCHIDITHEHILTPEFKEVCDKFAEKYCIPPNIYVCKNGQIHQVTNDEYVRLVDWSRE